MKPTVQAFCFFCLLSLSFSCLAEGDPLFVKVDLESGSSPSMSAGIGDLDLDGDLDVMVVRKNRPAVIYLNDGTGTFALSDQELPNEHFTDVCIADLDDDDDLDGDGDLDMIIANSNIRDQIWLNDGNGRFDQATSIPPQ